MPEPLVDACAEPLPGLSIFDFDGTLTWRDSFVPFLRFAFGNYRFALKMSRTGLSGVGYLYGAMDRDRMKARLIRHFLKGVEANWVADKAHAFCEANFTRMMRPEGLLGVADELAQGRIVSLCSASPAIVLEPFAKRLGVSLIATELEVVNGVLTGRINGLNCRRAEKVRRLERAFGALEGRHLRAWGNSSGDTELLAAADEAHYQLFNK